MPWPSPTSTCAGGSSAMSLNGVRGASGNQNVNIWSRAIGSSSALMPGTCEQRLDLGGEGDGSVTHRIVDRPHAGAVARQHQALTACVPDGKGEVAVERLDAIGPPLLVEVDDDLGVGRRLEDVAAGDQLGAQLDVVEDLAVEGDPDGAVLVAHRLLAAVEIDDAEARVRETDVAVDVMCRCRPGRDAQALRSCAPAVRGAPRAPQAVDSSRQYRTCPPGATLPLRKLSADEARPRFAGKAGEQRTRSANLGEQRLVARVHDHGGT